MHATIIELEFIELPHTPSSVGGTAIESAQTGNGFLLSMWNASCRMARWCPGLQRFEDSEGALNPKGIRAWARLPQALETPAWGASIVEMALRLDQTHPDAGWLEPTHVPPACAAED